ncbi:MAG: carboxypeptidase regulatory-like domain-containing protein [Acidobacteria bacterium]|nr:carboxypeptidase regulatory-like domain-containing protein [Acidobacteriota bacterium]
MKFRSVAGVCFSAALLLVPVSAQETRSMLFGRVLDPSGSAIAGASVAIKNADTGVALNFKTNDTGYYEGNLLMPGQYELTAEHAGFKKMVRRGITLPVSSRIEVNIAMELGGVTETVSVTAEAPMLETNAVSSGRVLDNKTVMELPLMGNSAMLLVKLTPGIQTGGVNNYLALHSNAGGSDYNVGGNVGGNSWALDGSPNQGPGRRTAYLPYTDAIAEFKVETNNFDAGIGQTSGAAITMISKSGTNDFHGTATWQHWQQRWQGTPFFVKKNYYSRIAAAEAAGNTALANELRSTDKQPTGRSNNWGASGGGPVVIPKIYDGKNKLFWFFTYNAFKDVKVEDPSTFNRTVPTLKAREGDFSDMLQIANSQRYIVYDPNTVVPDPSRPTHYLRTPFAGNIIPRSRFVNPTYDFYKKLYPNPNVAIPVGQDPVNNYLASQTPYNWDYKAYSNRVDYQLNDKWRMYGRWSFNNFGPEDRADWVYETARGLNLNGLVRNNKGGNVDVVYTQSSSTIWDFNLAMNQFREGNIQPMALSYKPSDVGLPKYMDDFAGDQHIMPRMTVSDTGSTNTGYSQVNPSGITNWTRTRSLTAKAEVTHIRGKHSLKAAFDIREQFRTGGGGGNTSGNFSYSDTWVRKDDDGNSPRSDLGRGWAAFILGIPNNGYGVTYNDTYALHNPYYGWYVQDNWRVTPKLTLNLGLRMEYELGATERYNRAIGPFESGIALPIAKGAEANYAKSPVPELPASQFKIAGGNTYLGSNGYSRRGYKNEFMWLPRFGAAYQMNSKTVIGGGYGIFFDTINVLNFGPNQYGYSRGTNPILSTNFGQSWLSPSGVSPANNKSPLLDPFWVRADGTRFDTPQRDGLGSMARVGRGYDYSGFNQPHARQQRWQARIQRQISELFVITAAYAGSYSDRISIQTKLDALPQQYWADGLVRNDSYNTNMNSNVTNPYYINNLNQADFSPVVWADMKTNGFYTSPTIRKNQILRPFPHMTSGNGLRDTGDYGYYTRSDELQVNFEKRFNRGWNFNIGYTAMKLREADFRFYEWDTTATERTSNDGRPHRVVATGIYELPFGKGKRFGGSVNKGMNLIIGGWQMAATYEYQPGPLLNWGNLFYYGNDISNINNVNRTWDTWFNTADFERSAAKGPAGYHRRVFPTRVPDLRRDMTNQWNANVSKNLPITERVNMQLRFDALNVQNRSQMDNPNTDPYSTNFGKITAQTSATNRWLQVQARITF